MFLLALLPLARNTYEQQAIGAVRRYLFRVTLPAFIACLLLTSIGCGLYWYGVDPLYLCAAYYMLLLLFLVCHLFRMMPASAASEYEHLDEVLSGYAAKLVALNNLQPINVYQFTDNSVQAWIIRDGEERIIVSDTLVSRTDAIGQIGILGHELAHRELPLGTLFPQMLQTAVHYFPDTVLLWLNKRVGVVSQLFIEQQKIMDPREATRMLAELSMLHALSKLCWHMSSSPALRLREYACDAIAVCIVRNPYPLIHGLSMLRRPLIAPYPYLLDAHPQTAQRISALMEIERNIVCTP